MHGKTHGRPPEFIAQVRLFNLQHHIIEVLLFKTVPCILDYFRQIDTMNQMNSKFEHKAWDSRETKRAFIWPNAS